MKQQIRSRTAKNNFDHVVTLKYMNPLLYKEIHFQSVKYIINGQSTNINVFLLFFSFVFLQIERERDREWYIKFGYKGEIVPKLLILFFDGVPLEILSSFTG